MALAERYLAAQYNRVDTNDHYTYALCGDGDLQEGISYEACSFAGHQGLGKLILLYDDNRITIDGSTDLSWCEDVDARSEAMGWHAQSVDGHDREAIDAAIDQAKAETQRPSMIRCRTHIGHGSPNKTLLLRTEHLRRRGDPPDQGGHRLGADAVVRGA